MFSMRNLHFIASNYSEPLKACIVLLFQTVFFGHFYKESVLVWGVDAEMVYMY